MTPLEEAYAADRRHLILVRVRWSAGLAIVPIACSALVNALVFSDRVPERLATHALEVVLCAVTLVVSSRPFAARRAVVIALVFLLGMEASLLWALSLSPGDLDVLVCPIASTMVASTLLFPWGIGPQAIASVVLAGGYLLLPPWTEMDSSRIANVSIGLALGGLTSLVGAWVLDRQRRATFSEREQVATLARQRELLVEAGRELNGTLELSALVDRIVRQARRLVGVDGAGLVLVNERRGVLVQAAAVSDRPELIEHFTGVEFPVADAPLLDELRRRGVLYLPDGSAADQVHVTAQRLGFERTLYVPIERDGRMLGFLCLARHAGRARLTAQDRSLAEAFAHQAAIALANARLVDDLQTASRVKSEFVSTMSHELRTPLNVILGFAAMARDGAIDEPVREDCLGRIEAAGRDLLGLIESTLEIGRIDAGRDELQLAPVGLNEFWLDLREACSRIPRGAEVRLEWSERVTDVELLTDPRKLTVVVRNLVGNALKFTERGWVRAEARLEGDELVLRIADTGVGIRSEDHEAIFEMFRQADGSDTRRYGGTGLGLYIVRRFVQQLGGRIGVESAPGRGSVFTVRLPARGRSVRAAA